MSEDYETRISRSIVTSYHRKLCGALVGDALIVGAGASGLMAALELARRGHKVTVLERRLAPGGGIWGGAMGMNDVVIPEGAYGALDGIPVKMRPCGGGLAVVDAVELAAALTLSAVHAGATVLNLTFAEDLCIHEGRVTGVVANRTGLDEKAAVDPICLRARAVLDATGHEAALVGMLRERGRSAGRDAPREGPMDAVRGEAFVVEHVAEFHPGLWISGMCVAAAMGGPRMGPIFGGMLLSGKRAAALIDTALGSSGNQPMVMEESECLED